jgi:hypothetical protein
MQSFVIESLNGFTADLSANLYNELGQLIYVKNASENITQLIIPTHDLRVGMYIVNLSSNNINKSFKFIIK